VNLDKIPTEKYQRVKQEILQKKLKRSLEEWGIKVKDNLKINNSFLNQKMGLLNEKITNLEKKYRHSQKNFLKKSPKLLKYKVDKLILAGKKLIEQEKLNEAEKCFIEIISLDNNNLNAYRYLGEIYLKQKDLSHAKQTFDYILDLNLKEFKKALNDKKDDTIGAIKNELAKIYFDLGEMYNLKEKFDLARKNLEKSLEFSPKNPKYLDFLCNLYIILKDKEQAQKILARVKDVNPDNQKIVDLQDQVNKLK
jgi:tetratricopeptide (TPR) repeat protein